MFSPNLGGGDLFALAGSDSGTVLLATKGATAAVSEYDGLGVRPLSFPYSPPDLGANISSLAYAPNGDLWVGTRDRGVFRLRRDGFTQFKDTDGLGDRRVNDVWRVLVEADGTVWAATNGGGASRYDGVRWTSVTVDSGLPSNDVMDVARARDGSVWFALGSGLARYSGPGAVTSYSAGGALNRLLLAADGRVWATSPSEGGLVFTPGNPVPEPYLAKTDLTSIVEGPHGDIWIGSFGKGLYRFDGAALEHFDTDANSGIISNTVRDLHVDRAGVLWLGTAAGLQRYEGSQWLTFSQSSRSLPGGFVTDLSRGPAEDLVPAPARGVTRGPIYVALDSKPTGPGGIVRVAGLTVEPVLNGGAPQVGPFTAVVAVPGGAWAASGHRVYRLQGAAVVDSLTPAPTQDVYSLLVRRNGELWAGTQDSLYRYDGTAWSSVRVPGFSTVAGPGPAHANIYTLAEAEPRGRVWAGSKGGRGAVRIDPGSGAVETFDTRNGLLSDNVYRILITSSGDAWLATDGGAARVSGSRVEQTLTTADGLPSNYVRSLGEDQSGRLWLGTRSGLVYLQDGVVATYDVGDGLPTSVVTALVADTSEAVLGSDENGWALFRRDNVPPRGNLRLAPPPVLAARTTDLSFDAGDTDSPEYYIRFATALDSPALPPATAFGSQNSVRLENLADGPHVLSLYVRDRALNLTRRDYRFDVDATPPQPLLSAPAFGAVVHGDTTIKGSVADSRFKSYKVDVRSAADLTGPWITLASDSVAPVPGAPLGRWNTTGFADGIYDVRLSVQDQLGLVGYAVAQATVDNLPPFDAVTSPVRLDNQAGGRVFTLNSEVEAYFPPRALDDDRIVQIDSLERPATLPPGTANFLKAWQIRIRSGASLVPFHTAKPITLRFRPGAVAGGSTLAPQGRAAPATPTLAVFARDQSGSYRYLGGTVDFRDGSVTTTATDLDGFVIVTGLYASASGGRELDVQPRAFSPEGRTFDTQAAVSFTLSDGGDTKVYVYDRGGRLVRRVFEGTLGAGRNVLYWDGKDGNGSVVPSGMYIVALQAGGATDVRSVAVVNR